jgi:plastocyanin
MFAGSRGKVGRRAVVLVAFAMLLITACSSTSEQGTTGPPSSAGGSEPPGASETTTGTNGTSTADAGWSLVSVPEQPDVQHLHYEIGPLEIQPGQNNITWTTQNGYPQVPKPTVDGYITRIRANLVRSDGSVPPVDVIHLHHGVWANASGIANPSFAELFFAAGEEKTDTILPPGYGYRYRANDVWVINYMLHNLLSSPDEVSLTYDLDFIPMSAPGAASIRRARPIWMDVRVGEIYPVFDVLKGSGAGGTFTYPDQATDPYQGRRRLNEWKVDRELVLLSTGGHLHPGGLHTDLFVTRPGAGAAAPEPAQASIEGDRARVFRSDAVYYEPAGAVSWDVSMSVTPPDWRVAVRPGDTISISATYDTRRASWYESMGIMVMWVADGTDGVDPFVTSAARRGVLTHGHLPENDNHGGTPTDQFLDLTVAASGPATDTVGITDFVYSPGDMSARVGSSVPTVAPGGTIRFVNNEATATAPGIWHTITSCKAPCDAATGVAYPLADADVQFDSGELGDVGSPTAGRLDWTTPTDLEEGTYTYFCRIHPSMRGAFRVEG